MPGSSEGGLNSERQLTATTQAELTEARQRLLGVTLKQRVAGGATRLGGQAEVRPGYGGTHRSEPSQSHCPGCAADTGILRNVLWLPVRCGAPKRHARRAG